MKFTKMHGLGNDFIILNGLNLNPNFDYHTLAVKLCDRHLGIGADGLVIVQPSATADIYMKIINSDGSEPAMCGNAIRCFAKYLYERKLITAKRFTVQTKAGLIIPELIISGGKVTSVKVNMGKPFLIRKGIPMTGPENELVISEPLEVDGQTFHITSFLMNVPHTVIFMEDIDTVNPEVIGPLIEKHPVFPSGTNVNFVEVVSDNLLKVKTWERGVGYTLACGTGCCAATIAAVLNNLSQRQVTIQLEVGELSIEWKQSGTVYMSGPAEEVFSGEISTLDFNRLNDDFHNIYGVKVQNIL